MIIRKSYLYNFRNHESYVVQYDSGINFITGQNGSGKTNIIESISVLSNLKSFRDASDEDMIKWNTDYYHIICDVLDYSDNKFEVGYSSVNGKKKKVLKINESQVLKSIDFYGHILNVFFTPMDNLLISGSISIRRRYFDSVISKTNKNYLGLIYKCRKMYNDRNILLKKNRNAKFSTEYYKSIEVWTDMISSLTVDIVKERKEFINNLNLGLYSSYNNISGMNDGPHIEYFSDFFDRDKNCVYNHIMNSINNDIKYGFSTKGIHRDIYNIKTVDNRFFKDVSSQGEIRSAAIALKASEKEFIEKESNKKSIILVDDIFSELDAERKKNMINLFQNGNQVIMTMANYRKEDFETLSEINVIEIDKSIL